MRHADSDLSDTAPGPLGSIDVILAFMKYYRQATETVLADLGVTEQTLTEALLGFEPSAEKPRQSDANMSAAANRTECPKPRLMTKVVKAAMDQARLEALANAKTSYTAGDFVAAMLGLDCDARSAVLTVSRSEQVCRAQAGLRSGTFEEHDYMAVIKENTRKLLDIQWPGLRGDGSPRIATLNKQRDQLYDLNPDTYEKPLVLKERLNAPVPEAATAYSHKAGVCLHAAGNEARMRKAAEVTLDHMLLALLQDGTDTSAFLDARRIDRNSWRLALDGALARPPEGPRWPPNARDLGMSVPSGGRELFLKKPLPENVEQLQLTRAQLSEYAELRPTGRKFTDLVWLRGFEAEERTIGHRLLGDAGITLDEIRAEIRAIETGDPEWYKVRPNLAQLLRDGKAAPVGLSRACREAADYEARLRWAPKIQFEHLLLALVGDGTDTAQLLDSLGIDRVSLREELDSILPRFEIGPFFPGYDTFVAPVTIIADGENASSDVQILEEEFDGAIWRQDRFPRPGMAMLERRGLTSAHVKEWLMQLNVKVSLYPVPGAQPEESP